MSPTGEAVVVYAASTPGYLFSRYRPAGGAWTGATEVIKSNYQNALETLELEFDGAGRTVAVAVLHEFDYTVHYNIGDAGVWNADTTLTLNDDGDPPATQYFLRRMTGIARHPNGLVATWMRQPSQQNTNSEVVVGRWNGSSWDLKVFDPPTGALASGQLAVNGTGEILLAADWFHGNVDEIHASIAPSLTAAVAGSVARCRRSASARDSSGTRSRPAAAPAFSVGWGVHGGSNDADRGDLDEARRQRRAQAPRPRRPRPRPPRPRRPRRPRPRRPPRPPRPNRFHSRCRRRSRRPRPTRRRRGPSAIADFTTLPAASTCVKARKLTIRFKKPPKGYTVKTVTVKVNAKKVATVKGKQLKKPLYLRKLPKGTFTVTVSITLTKGKGLTEKRRYTACK